MSESQPFCQLRDCQAECFRYYLDITKSKVSLASFDATQISSIQSAVRRECFLRKTFSSPQFANPLPKPLENIVSVSHTSEVEPNGVDMSTGYEYQSEGESKLGKWTVTVVGYLLRQHGSGPVYPLALTSNR